MVYIEDHAISRYEERFGQQDNTASAEDKLILCLLSAEKVIDHLKHPEIKAYLKGDMTIIARVMGKDQYVMTVEYRYSDYDNWWKRGIENEKED